MSTELPIIFTILILNLLVVFLIKSRTTTIIVIMFSNLMAILFYSQIILDPQNLKELIIATIIYSTTILTLIANSNHIYKIHVDRIKNTKFIISILLIGIFTTLVASGVFYLTKNIGKISSAVKEKQIARQNEIAKNPLIFPGHLAHINVKKYYLQGSYDDGNSYRNNLKVPEIKELYSEIHKQKLHDNILFKRLTDAIIIMAGVITILLLNLKEKEL